MLRDKARQIAREHMSQSRFQHCLGVAEIASRLAEVFGQDPEKAYITGVVHDIARGLEPDKLLKLAQANNLLTDSIDQQVPVLLHAPVGAYILENEYKITDNQILSAVSNHTLGQVNMSIFDQIIFLADMIEPGRDYPGVEKLRIIAGKDLNKAMLMGLENTIRYCLNTGSILHPRTVKVRNYFLKCIQDSSK